METAEPGRVFLLGEWAWNVHHILLLLKNTITQGDLHWQLRGRNLVQILQMGVEEGAPLQAYPQFSTDDVTHCAVIWQVDPL